MKTLKQFKEEYQIDERYDKDLDADGNGKLTKNDFKLLRAKKKKSDCMEARYAELGLKVEEEFELEEAIRIIDKARLKYDRNHGKKDGTFQNAMDRKHIAVAAKDRRNVTQGSGVSGFNSKMVKKPSNQDTGGVRAVKTEEFESLDEIEYNNYGKEVKTPKMVGMHFYNIPKEKEEDAKHWGLKQTKSGKWGKIKYDTSGASHNDDVRRTDMKFGKSTYWEPTKMATEEFGLDEISNDLANIADRMRTNRQHAAYDTSQEAGEKSSIKAAATHKLVTNTIARNQRMKNGPAILKPEAMSGTASLAFQGSKTRKEDYDFDEGYDSREAYDSWDPKHPDFVKNYKKYQSDNANLGSMKDFIDKEKARPTRLPK